MKAEGVFKDRLAAAVDDFLSTVNKPKAPGIQTKVAGFDEVVGGGVPHGIVVVLLGDSGVGKSTLLRNVAVHASGETHVLYVPLQDGGISAAACKLVALEAAVSPALLADGIDSQTRIAAIDAGDRLKDEHDLSVFVEDGLMVSPMLCEAVAEDFAGYRDATEDLEGYEGLVVIDSLSMLADGQDVRSAIRALKSIVYGSQISVIVAAAGTPDSVNDFADADMVILAEAGKGDAKRYGIELSILRDGTGLSIGNTAKVSIDRKTQVAAE